MFSSVARFAGIAFAILVVVWMVEPLGVDEAAHRVAGRRPVNTVPPAISGLAFPTDRVFTTTGAWRHPPASYMYQWRDCDTSGNECHNATGAGNRCTNAGIGCTYTVAESDEGYTLEMRVTARNASGSSAPVDSKRFPTRGDTVPGAAAILTESFNGTYHLGYGGKAGACTDRAWCSYPPSNSTYDPFGWYRDRVTGNKALRITTCPIRTSHTTPAGPSWDSSGYPICTNGETAGGSYPYGTQANVNIVCTGQTHVACPFNDTASGSPGSGQVFWYRIRFKFARHYRPAPYGYNYVFEMFDELPSARATAVSPTIKINTDSPQRACHTDVRLICTIPGRDSAIFIHYTGGSITNPQTSGYLKMRDGSLRRNVWYDLILYYKWSTTNGAVRFWINFHHGSGWQREGSVSGVPTAYYTGASATPDCAIAGNSCHAQQYMTAASLYHAWATWAQTAYFQDFVTGPTSASIGVPRLVAPR